MKLLLIAFLTFSTLYGANSASLIEIKRLLQKEEYLSLAINKYILQTRKLPIDSTDKFDFSLLKTASYLGTSFDTINPITKKEIEVSFNTTNKSFSILGIFQKEDDSYNNKRKYIYQFYINSIFRVNTQAPSSITKTSLLKGSEVLYGSLQNSIVKHLINKEEVRLDSEDCPIGNYYYEFKNDKLTYKYCKADYSFDVYQSSPIYIEKLADLLHVKGEIGDFAYVNTNGFWNKYYYQGEVTNPWIPVASGSILQSQDESLDAEDRAISYIPSQKDLLLRDGFGCMLANGDIFCWGNNSFKKAGIESYGQLDTSISSDYINTPVMLKVQIDNVKKVTDDTGVLKSRRDKRWYNNPYRIKFEKLAISDKSVCGLSPIFEYFQAGITYKYGGDLYCNGNLLSTYYEDVQTTNKSILKRNKYFALNKENLKDDDKNEIYLIDIAMLGNTTIVLSDEGNIYSFGENSNGALGINNTSFSLIKHTKLNNSNNIITRENLLVDVENTIFKKVFALRNRNTFGAIDSDNRFWIWGERENSNLLKPTKLLAKVFNKDRVFVNAYEFILKGKDNNFYKTIEKSSYELITYSTSLTNAISISILDDELLFIDENRKIRGTLLSCKRTDIANINKNNSNYDSTYDDCNSTDKGIFSNAILVLNNKEDAFSNVSIFKNSQGTFTCATVGQRAQSQLYCWGDASRSLPIVSTGLHHLGNKNINGIFVTPKTNLATSYVYPQYTKIGTNRLFLKYPTYLAGFDYEFYFK